mgnify:CR=1 FL=1
MNAEIYTALQLSNADYHAAHGLSSTALKELVQRSPAHCRALMDGLRRKTSDSMDLGTVVHSAVLEPDTFWDLYWLAPAKADHPEALDTVADYRNACDYFGADYKAKDTKAALRAALEGIDAPVAFWEDLKTCPDGKSEITRHQFDVASGISGAIRETPDAADLFSAGDPEVSFFALDEPTEVVVKARADCYLEKQGMVVDLKTCEDARPHAVQRAIVNYGYDLSAAMYLDVIGRAGMSAESFVWVFAETAPPYAIRVYVASSDMLEQAHARYRAGLEQFAWCRDTDSWPGYEGAAQVIDLPAWAKKSTDSEVV